MSMNVNLWLPTYYILLFASNKKQSLNMLLMLCFRYLLNSWISPATVSEHSRIYQECFVILQNASIQYSTHLVISLGEHMVTSKYAWRVANCIHNMLLGSPERDIIIACIPVQKGKFKVSSLRLEKCKGPKKMDCAAFEYLVENNKIIHYNFTIFENIAPLRAKVIVGINGKPLVRLQINKVCEHVIVRPIMESIFNVTKTCVILKGRYTFSLDYEALIQKYYAGEFFYGNVSLSSVMNNKKCNFSCTTMRLVLVSKD